MDLLFFPHPTEEIVEIENGILGDVPRPITREAASKLVPFVKRALSYRETEILTGMGAAEKAAFVSSWREDLFAISSCSCDRDPLPANPFEV